MKTEKHIIEVEEDIRDIIPNFIQNKRKDFAELKEALKKNDFKIIQHIGHVWRGSGSMFKFNFLTEKGAALETAAKNGRTEEIRKLISETENYFNNLEIKYVKAGIKCLKLTGKRLTWSE